jgi:hypothetical protein
MSLLEKSYVSTLVYEQIFHENQPSKQKPVVT